MPSEYKTYYIAHAGGYESDIIFEDDLIKDPCFYGLYSWNNKDYFLSPAEIGERDKDPVLKLENAIEKENYSYWGWTPAITNINKEKYLKLLDLYNKDKAEYKKYYDELLTEINEDWNC
ncbi:hypothetical protein AAEX28_13415 [Lentisphaerota bacterium WC36G]|nr:hypothetical protein LJT99_00170 [Lentisphaerae bacterium WC36]